MVLSSLLLCRSFLTSIKDLERLNEVYSEFFLYYDEAPLLIVNASEIDLASGETDYRHLVDYLLDVHSGRHYFNPTFFG